QGVLLGATVAAVVGQPIGTITFFDGTGPNRVQLGPAIQINFTNQSATQGVATSNPIAALAAGVHTITAHYTPSVNTNLFTPADGTGTHTVNSPSAPLFSRVVSSPDGSCICTPIV